MHWHILGAGAIGCLFATRLQDAGLPVTLLLRKTGATRTVPVTLDTGARSRQYLVNTSDHRDHEPITHLLVTTKAFDVRSAVQGIRHRLRPETVILLLVNGMGLIEELQQDLPENSLFAGTTTEGAYRVGPLHVHHAGHGDTNIGGAGQLQPPPWFDALAMGSCHWRADIEQALWQKLAINCAINPLTALHRCPNSELGQRADLSRQVTQLCEEIAAISRAAGHGDTATTLHEMTRRVISATAKNRSSMLQDILAGRRTEIDYITGYLLRVGHRYGISAPYNAALLESIHRLEKKND